MDNSGSMKSLGKEPIDSLNNFYKDQIVSGNFNSTLVFFNNKVDFIHKNILSSKLETISYDKYVPNGMTALYDAIGDGIEYQKTIHNDNVIVVILTDGLENSSQKYNKSKIKDLVSKLEKDNGWKFIYLGANQDSFEVGKSIGVNTSSNYEYSPIGINCIMRTVSNNISYCLSNKTPVKDISLDQQEKSLQISIDSLTDERTVTIKEKI